MTENEKLALLEETLELDEGSIGPDTVLADLEREINEPRVSVRSIAYAADGVETLEGISPGNLSPRIVISLLGINLVVEFLLRVIIGCCSRLEGRGEKAGSFYIFLTGVLAVMYVGKTFSRIMVFSLQHDVIDQIVLLFIDITSLVLLVELLVAVYRARRLAAIIKAREDEELGVFYRE